jgi:hypothetical protein
MDEEQEQRRTLTGNVSSCVKREAGSGKRLRLAQGATADGAATSDREGLEA